MSTDAVGGVWTYASELRSALGAAGVEVVLATLGPCAPPQEDVAWCRCRLEWQEDPWSDVRESGDWLRELAEDERVDLVHLNGYAHAASRWDVPVVAVAHSCVLSWHEAVRGAPAGESWARYRREVAAGLGGADAVVAPTAAMRSSLRRLYGFDERCDVIPNGVSAPASRPTVRQPVVLGAGRLWDEAKGLDTLDAAAARIGWPVLVAGDAGGASARHARLLGPLGRDELRRRMGAAAIFAHPARYEPFGLVVLEAAQAGCALVLGDIDSLREQWDGAALFVAPSDDVALAAALATLVENAELRDALATAARLRARRGDARTMAARYVELYERVRARVTA
ncbi:MAG TPA: glycosyltransferase family 4 protein [Solirubrobacteraceae bacterium]|nr:glycosyltransferase family 4 protein [Solirubrobacteraceae bacterium]